MYFSYEFITVAMEKQSTWISSFKEMTEFFTGDLETKDVKMYLTMLISWPIPLISVFLLKSAVDYLKPEEELVIKTLEPKEINLQDIKAKDREDFRSQFSTENKINS